ncbi:hypothetical protein DFQ01_102173 [Paenibacillus cellulosilyticus]|uniref:Lanthionine synthetase-like protein n=1 Tax=Paenibacillus cellulosilyticus TaxID=375489 RepID=A0A2V2Z167_9BACL|nr:hypothetical protein [Paenibacillus cellulosilyticus]PWW07281.1 hypothetical protein DFQ01_102173 [Paenibacillus cellulosilyticus]QKS44531.1 hypothetical protein HUB94_08985 [Paenibacillus cellulosilyticus]
MTDIRPFLATIRRSIAAHRTGAAGGHRRKLSDSVHAADLYGTANAVILLYTLNELPMTGTDEHRDFVTALQQFQDPHTGLFNGIGHHPLHGTAFAISALELLDSKPLYPLTDLQKLKDPAALYDFLDNLSWVNQPWAESHKGAGLYAAMVLAGEVDASWEEAYFNWLYAETDPITGLWQKGAMHMAGSAPLFHHLASSFHYLFNLNYRNRKMRFPDAWIDTCLQLHAAGEIPLKADALSFVELDVLYTLIAAGEQTDYRSEELRAMIDGICHHLLKNIESLSTESEGEVFDDLHELCGTTCALALVQSAMPEQVDSDRVLLKVLDRRPFI